MSKKVAGQDKLEIQLKSIAGVGKIFPRPVGQIIAKRASQIAPRDTGFMAENIVVEETTDGTAVVSKAPYSVHVEFGTYKMAAQPFMRPALAETENDVLKAAAKAVMEEIRRVLR